MKMKKKLYKENQLRFLFEILKILPSALTGCNSIHAFASLVND